MIWVGTITSRGLDPRGPMFGVTMYCGKWRNNAHRIDRNNVNVGIEHDGGELGLRPLPCYDHHRSLWRNHNTLTGKPHAFSYTLQKLHGTSCNQSGESEASPLHALK